MMYIYTYFRWIKPNIVHTITFCEKLNRPAIATFAALPKAYGDPTVSKTTVFQRFQGSTKFWKPLSFWKANLNENEEVVRAVMVKDRRLSVRIIAKEKDVYA